MPSTNHNASKLSVGSKLALALGGCLLIGIIWIVAFHKNEPAEAKNPSPPPEMFKHQGDEYIVPNHSPLMSHLKVMPVSSGGSAQVTSFPGMVEANTAASANIEPPLTGRIVQLNVKIGDHVHKGQVLAVMSSGDLAQAYADVSKAKDSLSLANASLKRAREVNAIGANANKDLEAAQSTQIQAKDEYERATQRLKTLAGHGAKLSGSEAFLPIVSPINGDVTALNVGLGSFINDNTNAILTIANFDQVWVTANIPEAQLNQVHTGLEVDVTFPAYPNQVFHGRIGNISNVLDSDTRRTKARILFDNSNMKLKPNMFATVQIKNNNPQKITVPQSALLMNNEQITVFVEIKPHTYVRKVVELGSENDTDVQIVSGLNPSDRVIVSGGVLLND